MSWIDVAILAVVVLVGLVGVFKGLKKSALALGAFLVAFLLAFFLANVIAEALLGIDGIKKFVLGDGFAEGSTWSLAKMIYAGVGKMQLDEKSFLAQNFYAPMIKIVSGTQTSIPADQGFALYGAFMMFSAICGVGIFMVVRFLLAIVTAIIKSYISKKKTVLSRLLGFLLGAVRGALWMLSFTIVFSCMGGYTFVSGINSIQNEYENNTVVCNYFNDWAYGLRNKLLLPDGNAYGRLVEMVFKSDNKDDPNAEKLSYDRLRVFVSAHNLNYDSAPWSITEQKKRHFDEAVANGKERKASEFESTGFDGVAQAILDYNKTIWEKVGDTTDATMNSVSSETFAQIAARIETGSNANINDSMDDLWAVMRQYEKDYKNPTKDVSDLTTYNNTLALDYAKVIVELNNILAKYKPLINIEGNMLGEMAEIEVPAVKKFTEADLNGKPEGGGSETKPEGGDSETKPEGGDSETKPEGGDSETKPVGGDSETKPEGGDSETKPEGGDSETKPEGGE